MKHDPVERPQHYNMGTIEVLDFILDQALPYLAGNIVKYVCRYRYKGNPVEDLKKARFYLDRLIKETETGSACHGRHDFCGCHGNCQEGGCK